MADKVNKQRKLTKTEIDELAKQLVEDCKKLQDGEEIDAKKIANKYNISLALVDKVYIKAIELGLPRLILTKTSVIKSKSDVPFINERESIMIGKSVIHDINKSLDDDKKFKVNDKFTVTGKDGAILLTKISE